MYNEENLQTKFLLEIAGKNKNILKADIHEKSKYFHISYYDDNITLSTMRIISTEKLVNISTQITVFGKDEIEYIRKKLLLKNICGNLCSYDEYTTCRADINVDDDSIKIKCETFIEIS